MRSEGQSVPAWRGDWERRIRERVQGLGFRELGPFLKAHPGVPYLELARLLAVDGDVAAVQLSRLHASSTDVSCRYDAAIDSLVRQLRGALRQGWGVGRYWQSAVAGAFAGWKATWGAGPELARLEEAIVALGPPRGWIPQATGDPLLRAAAQAASHEAMKSVTFGEDEYLDAQSVIYRELAQALYDILNAEQQERLLRVELLVSQNPLQGPDGQSFRVIYISTRGPAEPLIARPEVIDLCRRLDDLTRRCSSGSTWESFTYVLSTGKQGPTYECRYTYPV